MSKAPAMPLYVDAYMADTLSLSEAEDGVYMRLLMSMWRMEGRLPDDDLILARLARVPKARWVKKYRPKLEVFFDIFGGFWSQKRLKKEWRRVSNKITTNRQNGATGGRHKSLKNNDTGKANGLSLGYPNPNPNPNPERTQSETRNEPKTGIYQIHTHNPPPNPPWGERLSIGFARWCGDYRV